MHGTESEIITESRTDTESETITETEQALESGTTTDSIENSSDSVVSFPNSSDFVQYFGGYESSNLNSIYGYNIDDTVATEQIIQRLDSIVLFSSFNFVLLGAILLIMIGKIFTRIFKDIIYVSF